MKSCIQNSILHELLHKAVKEYNRRMKTTVKPGVECADEAVKAGFDRDGYAAFRPLFDESLIAEINREVDRYIADVAPIMPPERVYREGENGEGLIKQIQQMFEYDGWARRLIETGPIRRIAEALLEDDVRAVNMQYFNKPPGVGKPTPPHQDGYYFHLHPCEAVTGWLALEPVDGENGCIHYVRGSHRQAEFRSHAQSGVLGFSQAITDFGTPEDEAGTVVMAGDAGTFLMHHAKTIHWAGANRSARRSRRALGFIYYAAGAKHDEAAAAAYQAALAARLKDQGKI